MQQHSLKFVFAFFLLSFAIACGEPKDKVAQYDSPRSGRIIISVDESFKPVIAEQIKVYQASFPGTEIKAYYKPEAECLRDLQQDSVRLVIVSRGLSEAEIESFTNYLSYKPQFDIVAYDAIAAIINMEEKDSIYSLKKLSDLVLGKDSSMKVVMDGRSATSAVSYIFDSLTNGKGFGKNTEAAAGSQGVLDYIASNAGAIGFVGSSWVGNSQIPAQKALAKRIKLAFVECKCCDSGTYAKASQIAITYGQYPLVRPLYFILKENATGLGTGFTNFLSLERGQLIFRRSNLAPAKIGFGIRKTLIDEN